MAKDEDDQPPPSAGRTKAKILAFARAAVALLLILSVGYQYFAMQQLEGWLNEQSEALANIKSGSSSGYSHSQMEDVGDKMAALQVSLASLETRVAALEAVNTRSASATSEQTKKWAELSGELEKLKGQFTRVGELSAALAESAADLAENQDHIAALEEELHALSENLSSQSERQDRESATGRWQMQSLLLFDQLKNALMAGRVYTVEYQEMMDQIGTTGLKELLQPLGAYRERGLPTWQQLHQQFNEALRHAAASKKPSPEAGILEKFASSVRGLVTVRKVGNQPGSTPEAILARAEAAMNKQDVPSAIKEVESLPAEVQVAFEEWLPQARVHTLLPDLLHQLRRSLLETPGKGNPS